MGKLWNIIFIVSIHPVQSSDSGFFLPVIWTNCKKRSSGTPLLGNESDKAPQTPLGLWVRGECKPRLLSWTPTFSGMLHIMFLLQILKNMLLCLGPLSVLPRQESLLPVLSISPFHLKSFFLQDHKISWSHRAIPFSLLSSPPPHLNAKRGQME